MVLHTDLGGVLHIELEVVRHMDFVAEVAVFALRPSACHNCRRSSLHRLPGFGNRDKSWIDLLKVGTVTHSCLMIKHRVKYRRARQKTYYFVFCHDLLIEEFGNFSCKKRLTRMSIRYVRISL